MLGIAVAYADEMLSVAICNVASFLAPVPRLKIARQGSQACIARPTQYQDYLLNESLQ